MAVAAGGASVGGREVAVDIITGAVAVAAGAAQPAKNKTTNRDLTKRDIFFSFGSM
jgi:hypothetical protein